MDLAAVPALGRFIELKRSMGHLLRKIDDQTSATCQDVTALLDGADYTVSSLAGVCAQLERLARDEEGLASRVGVLASEIARRQPAPGAQVEELVQRDARMGARLTQLSVALDGLQDRIDRMELAIVQAMRPGTLGGNGEDAGLLLCSYLAPFVSSRHVIDVGAHRGRYTRALVDQGMDVVALEPEPGLARELRLAFDGATNVTVVEAAAAGSAVTIEDLCGTLGLPPEIGLLKIEADGAELDVLRGLGGTRPEVVVVEYRGPDCPLIAGEGTPGVGSLVQALLPTGLRHWITIVHEGEAAAFTVNNRTVPPRSWGNIVFFRDREAFLAGLRWCAAVLPERVHATLEAQAAWPSS